MTISIPDYASTISHAPSRRLLFVINDLAFLISHRLPVAQAALDAGFDVHVAAPKDLVSERKIADCGIHLHRLSMRRHTVSPISELRNIWQIYRIFRRVRPDTVHLVTIKPVLYGGIAARIARVPMVVTAISGLGFAFTSNSFKGRMIRFFVKPLYRLALGHKSQRVIFQNEHDRGTLENLGLDLAGRTEMIRGSGVDLEVFKPTPEPEGRVTIVVLSRLLSDKGIREFVEATQILKREGSTARFVLVGDAPKGNPAALSKEVLDAWKAGGLVEFWGFRHDMPKVLGQAHIVVLPSYREGLPKALIEAAACGRPVVTTNAPGCRDAVIENETGLLVPVRDAHALADAMRSLIDDKATRLRMGASGRKLAEQEFSIDHVTRRHLEIYSGLSGRDRSPAKAP